VDPLQHILSVFRAATRLYQTNHWRVSGPNFYGNHLLLQRLYDETFALEDKFGERLVGYFGPRAVEPVAQQDAILTWTKRWSAIKDPLKQSLQVANDVSKVLEQAYTKMKESGHMTLGLDDLIMATSNQVDEHIYLLQQAQR
jgi:DNA-binding ferritin-like protein